MDEQKETTQEKQESSTENNNEGTQTPKNLVEEARQEREKLEKTRDEAREEREKLEEIKATEELGGTVDTGNASPSTEEQKIKKFERDLEEGNVEGGIFGE